MYSFDLKNVVPSRGLTCLFAKDTIDESNLWHRRLGHINFKTMNKLVWGNLVRGLPSKLFENDHTCVASQSSKDAVADDAGKKTNEDPAKNDDKSDKDVNGNSIYRMFTPVNAAGSSCDNLNGSIPVNAATLPNDNLPTDPFMPDLEDTGIFSGAYNDEDVGAEADLNNLEKHQNVRLVDLPKGEHAIGTKWVYRNKKDERGIVVRNKARLVVQGYTQEEGIDYDEVFAHVAKIEAIRLFLAYASFMGFIVYQMEFPDKVYKVEKALYGLHQAPKAWYETLSTYLLENGFRRGIIDKTLFIKKDKEFESLMHKKFHMSSMGELTFFLGLQVMQRDDGIFISQDKFQFTPKVSHLYAVKRIFRYLKGQPKLGLWYPRESPFDLEDFSDSDYASVVLDREITMELSIMHRVIHGNVKANYSCLLTTKDRQSGIKYAKELREIVSFKKERACGNHIDDGKMALLEWKSKVKNSTSKVNMLGFLEYCWTT
ncbi:putative ribonuclease H-like domain-containing protein [Tanacetum coccineum]